MSYPERQTCQVQVNLAAGSAGKVVAPNPFVDDATPSARIASVRFASDADLALDGTNYFTGILKDPTDTNNLFTGFGNQSEALSQGGMQVGSKVAGAPVIVA